MPTSEIQAGDHYFTNAEEAYDYSCVKQVGKAATAPGKENRPKPWRIVEVVDAMRFEHFQLPRYGSGLCQAFKFGSEEAEFLGLHEVEE